MNPEAADMGLDASEQPDQTSSPCAYPPFYGPEISSTGHLVPGDLAITSNETQHTTPVDMVDAAAVDLLKGAVEDGPGEDLSAAKHKAQTAQYDGLSLRLLEDEKKTGDLGRRSKQAVLHLTFTEMRITQMEQQIRKLEAELHNKPDDFQLSVSMEIPFHEKASLEVLVTEHGTSAMLGSDHYDAGHSTRICQRTHQQTPERLRIRYAPLIKTLEKVCGETISNQFIWPSDSRTALMSGVRTGGAATILLRPWKLLVTYEKEIRASIHNIDTFVEPARREDVSGGVAEIGLVEDFEYRREDLLRELELLEEFLDVDLKPTFDLRRAIKEGTATEIEYGDLWHLFELGDTVISPNEKTQAFRVVNFTGGREILTRNILYDDETQAKPLMGVGGFAVDCCSLCFDGTEYVPKLEKFLIRKYHGRRPITSLEIFPLRFDQDWEVRYRELETQGQKYLSLTRLPFSHHMFRGRTIDEPPQQLDTQVIVDVTLAINNEPDWQLGSRVSVEDFTQIDERETHMPPFCHHGTHNEGHCGSDFVFKDLTMKHSGISPSDSDLSGFLRPRRAEELKQEDIILLPEWVHAFVLRSRQWVTLNTRDLSEVRFDNNFDELMFSSSHKQTIVALVETRENARTSPTQGPRSVGPALDLVKGKGAGLIILLHGEPGVGKTSTAECVADKTKRPLFPITCGDIGESAMEVEKNLHHNFRLAYKWGCVLLLDEADVFLAKRNKTDLRRNAVTSVFLRSLEYYAGILFLTTNRVGGIDPAFKSRIQLSLYYPRIDLETTVKLYGVFLQRARDEQTRIGVTHFKIKEKAILRFAARHYRRLQKEGYNTWNGRQIRNACQTAIALVEHEAAHLEDGQPIPVLGRQHFETVAEGSKEFDHYLKRTLQGGDDEIAMRDQWRNDHYLEADIKRPSSLKPLPKVSSSRTAPPPPIVTDSESESSDGSETDDKDDEDVNIKPMAEGGIAHLDAGADVSDDEISSADFKEYLKFKALMGKNKKK
ncbi:hypothetical protein J7T55_002711 [Diaporthe amygdali]|uniref:uncharacterized protein n=1 Tax=Phomopsis amygdali TaxID=1214568 RepID=UPI0022FEEADD|nr:uncharacterized protein J7T55_002711 [Diaporthe amygdali]KAJ0122199.1 hypothetical protein J7T55_002711 [Diaporthe amygdali]